MGVGSIYGSAPKIRHNEENDTNRSTAKRSGSVCFLPVGSSANVHRCVFKKQRKYTIRSQSFVYKLLKHSFTVMRMEKRIVSVTNNIVLPGTSTV